jgi:hypothetical protein
VSVEGNIGIGHEYAGHGFCVLGWDTPSPVHASKLPLLANGIVRQFAPFNVDLVSHQVVMGPHRNQFPRSHREGAGKQPRYSRYSHGGGAGTRTGYSEYE